MGYIFHIFCKLAQTGINWLRKGLDGQKKSDTRVFSRIALYYALSLQR